MKHLSSHFTPRALLRQTLLAGWFLVLAGVSIEWLLPGAVSSQAPIILIACIGVFVTLALGAFIAVRTSKVASLVGLLLPVGGALVGAAFFVLRERSRLVQIGVFLMVLLAVGLICAALLPDEDAQENT